MDNGRNAYGPPGRFQAAIFGPLLATFVLLPMPDLLLYSLIFAASLALLVKSSDFFTDAAEKIGLLLGLPSFIIGVTIVAIGTSIPELVSSLVAVDSGATGFVISNVVGSNITNIFLIIGIASVIGSSSLLITYDLVSVDLPLFVGSAFLLALEASDLRFSLGEAWLNIAAYIMYMFYTVKGSGDNPSSEDEEPPVQVERSRRSLIRQILTLVLSSIFIYIGARYTIDSLQQIATLLKINQDIITVSVVALGTSLPEMAVTVSATRKGQAELAVGNVLGSNVFNTFMVMGIPGLSGSLIVPTEIYDVAIPTMVAGTILLFFATQDKKLTLWEGWLFFILYAWFIGNMFNLM